MQLRLLVQFSPMNAYSGWDGTPRAYCFVLIDEKERRYSRAHRGESWMSIARLSKPQSFLVPGRLEFTYE